jgi:hypothetical protein
MELKEYTNWIQDLREHCKESSVSTETDTFLKAQYQSINNLLRSVLYTEDSVRLTPGFCGPKLYHNCSLVSHLFFNNKPSSTQKLFPPLPRFRTF